MSMGGMMACEAAKKKGLRPHVISPVGGSNELFGGARNDTLWADGWMREAANEVRCQEERRVA